MQMYCGTQAVFFTVCCLQRPYKMHLTVTARKPLFKADSMCLCRHTDSNLLLIHRQRACCYLTALLPKTHKHNSHLPYVIGYVRDQSILHKRLCFKQYYIYRILHFSAVSTSVAVNLPAQHTASNSPKHSRVNSMYATIGSHLPRHNHHETVPVSHKVQHTLIVSCIIQ